MSECKICKKNHSKYLMNAKPVCFTCDELLFDIEIECDESASGKRVGREERNEKEVQLAKLN